MLTVEIHLELITKPTFLLQSLLFESNKEVMDHFNFAKCQIRSSAVLLTDKANEQEAPLKY